MDTPNPFDLLFADMDKLGPGSDAETTEILHRLPIDQPRLVVDAGCGTGRQTLVLARELDTIVQAIDTHAPFLERLRRRAAEQGLSHRIQTHHMDMADIPTVFRDIDLLWSEGAAYNIGFPNALARWREALAPDGIAVVSELAWLDGPVPEAVRDFFARCYPEMRHAAENAAIAEGAGYRVLDTRTLRRESWQEGHYDALEPRAKTLVDHPDPAVRAVAEETLKEIDVFRTGTACYDYVFYVLRRA